jgi:hypothetical protein
MKLQLSKQITGSGRYELLATDKAARLEELRVYASGNGSSIGGFSKSAPYELQLLINGIAVAQLSSDGETVSYRKLRLFKEFTGKVEVVAEADTDTEFVILLTVEL